MPCWFYEPEDLKSSPSRKDAIDEGTEGRYRREGARFIIEAGTVMKLRYDTMATGVVYFHRFYMFHSFKEFPRYLTGAACLFLAGKVEETPKKCKDIIRISKDILPEHHFAAFGDDPKEEIMTYERILLQTIKFDLQVEHPYSYLLKYAKTFKGDKEKIQKLVQMAWTFVNDSLCTTLCLQWEPHITAVAFLYLAGRLSKSDLLDWSGKSTKIKWWESLSEDVSLDIMEDVCHHLLDLYAAGKKGAQGGGQAKGTKRSKQKSPTMTETDKPKDEPKVKQPKVESAKSTPPPPPPPTAKAKASTPSKSTAAVAQHVKPATTTTSYKEVAPAAALPSKATVPGTKPQAANPTPAVPYSTTLPQQSYTIAPPVFSGTMTPPKYPPTTQASQFFPAEQVPVMPVAATVPLITPSQYTTPPVPVPPSIPQAPTAQYQPPYSNQYLPSSNRQDYSVPPPGMPSATNQTAVSTPGTNSSLYPGSGIHPSSGVLSSSSVRSTSGIHPSPGVRPSLGIHPGPGMHPDGHSSGPGMLSGLHTGVGMMGAVSTATLEPGPSSRMGHATDMAGPTRPSLQPPMVQGMGQRASAASMSMLQHPLTPTRQMMKTLPAALPVGMTSMGSMAAETTTGFQGRNQRGFGHYSTPPPLMSLPMSHPPKVARVPGRPLLPPKGSMAPNMWNQ